MLLQGRAEAVVRRRRIGECIEEPHRVLAGERDGLVTTNGLLRVSSALDTMNALTVLPSTEAARSIRRFAVSLSLRLMRSLRTVSV